ncbi:hypothetical protein [Clostridium kluyveri]|uniref:hypothetical protein n=1 Tax=Clostridium kluyveri TaxID=1534 RepID=UPI0012EC56B5|nr:hypothetical protein [Clostridium kluyveri]UZQ49519.1 hypothetical protein OP486_16420 [Clostridium kluyveri]
MTKEEIALQLAVAALGHFNLLEETKTDIKFDTDKQLTKRLGKHVANLYNTILDNINVK